ncbi:MAG: YajQ family cyclic di-GMP-binding protein [Pseudomonadales bacterium]|nr:YajQ family cyclic di-GMP-binding protein [Pseudomonadales bacterium]|tara:strand:- start:174 stop:656 length:483 start_codon:yes stop_codon:yes gene_type:complete
MATFDVVSEVDLQEMRNAVDQSNRELGTRFDFRDIDSGIELDGEIVNIWAEEEFQLAQLEQILRDKMAKRKLDADSLDQQDIEAAGKQKRQKYHLIQGIDRDSSKKIVKIVKETKLKVQAQIQGDKIRINGKKRDDLQHIMKKLREAELGLPLQFENLRE